MGSMVGDFKIRNSLSSAVGTRRAKRFILFYFKRVGPGAWKHRGARDLRRLRRMSDTHQFDVEIRTARGLCAPVSRDLFKLSAAQCRLAAAVHLNLRRDLASSARSMLCNRVASFSSP